MDEKFPAEKNQLEVILFSKFCNIFSEVCAENQVENFRAFRILSRNSFRSLRRNFLRFFGSLRTNFAEINQLFSEACAENFLRFFRSLRRKLFRN